MKNLKKALVLVLFFSLILSTQFIWASAAEAEMKSGGVLRYAMIDSPPTLDQQSVTSDLSTTIAQHWSEGLYAYNAEYEPAPLLAKSDEVKDDGNGLSRERILVTAIERGLVKSKQSESISNDELFQFIFEPGFSTAEKVTKVSGRGVGMDVVKKNIDLLRGTIVVQSKEGEGTSVQIQLPLTLAIIDGFLVEVGNLTCADVPLGYKGSESEKSD